jgi:hypothetical protein
MAAQLTYGPFSWQTMIRAVEKVRRRLERAVEALASAGIAYAVAGGNAVAAWVARVDEAAVRNTRHVDILIDRKDFEAARVALESAGFRYRRAAGVEMFLDAPQAEAHAAVHLVFAGEKVRSEYVLPAPSVSESEPAENYRVLSLAALVRMKLTSFRRKDQVHLLDLLELGLIDVSWCQRFPAPLAARLQELIDTPEG